MKLLTFITLFSLFHTDIFAQKDTFDIISFSLPTGWKKEVMENIIIYSTINNLNKTWCRIGIAKCIASKGNIESDFESEWQGALPCNPYPFNSSQSLSDNRSLQLNNYKQQKYIPVP